MEDPLAMTVPDMEEGELFTYAPLFLYYHFFLYCSFRRRLIAPSFYYNIINCSPPPHDYEAYQFPSTTFAVSPRSWGSSSLMMEDSPPLRHFAWADFDIMQKVGEGTTGSVYKAKFRGTETLYALKVFRHEADMGVSISALQEIKSFQRLRPLKYIVRLIGFAFTPKDEFVLVEEYMEHDLAGIMHSKRRFNEPHIKCIMHQLLSGLHECHQMQLIHRDIKSSNILMHNGNLRITDFGFMTTLENAARYQSCEIITLWYRPPELLLGTTTYGQEVDMWSAGCIFFELLTGEIAFRGRSSKDQLVLLFKTLGKPSEGVPSLPLWGEMTRDVPPYPNTLRERLGSRTSAQALDLLASLLSLDPKKRPTAAQALAHPFFTHGAAPCQPSDLPRWPTEAHEYELKKAQQQGSANAFRSSGGQRPPSGGLGQPRPMHGSSGVSGGHRDGGGQMGGGGGGGGGGVARRVPTHPAHHHQQHPHGGRTGPRGRDGILSHHHHHQLPQQVPREEIRKRPADVDWILNREKPSVKPTAPTSPPTSAPSRSLLHHDTKRLRTDLASPPPPSSSSALPRKRESSLPLATTKSEEERTTRRHAREKGDRSPPSPPTTTTTTTSAPSAGAAGGGGTKAKLIQPLRKSPTRGRLPAVPMSSLPVRRAESHSSASSRSPPPPPHPASTAAGSSAPSSKITIRRSKVGDKAMLRIVTPGSPPPPAPAKAFEGLMPHSDASRESKKRRQPSPAEGSSRSQAGQGTAAQQAAGQGHPRKVARRGDSSLHSSASSPSSSSASSSLSPPDASSAFAKEAKGDGLLPTPPIPPLSLQQQQQQRRQRTAAKEVPQKTKASGSGTKKGLTAGHKAKEGGRAGELYCTCRQPNDPSRWMIACDWCDSWYHGECEGLTQEEGNRIPKYKCRRCRGLVAKDE